MSCGSLPGTSDRTRGRSDLQRKEHVSTSPSGAGQQREKERDALVDVHADLAELERGDTDERQARERSEGRPEAVARREGELVREHDGVDGVDRVERGRTAKRDEDLPGREDVATGDLDRRGGESLCEREKEEESQLEISVAPAGETTHLWPSCAR